VFTMDFALLERASSQPDSEPENLEEQFYYAGLPSLPTSVGRSSTNPWVAERGLGDYPKPKMRETVGRHPINDVWEGSLSHEVIEYLDSKKVAWTSIDVVRIGYVEESICSVIVTYS